MATGMCVLVFLLSWRELSAQCLLYTHPPLFSSAANRLARELLDARLSATDASRLGEELAVIQSRLFNVGAAIATPAGDSSEAKLGLE